MENDFKDIRAYRVGGLLPATDFLILFRSFSCLLINARNVSKWSSLATRK